MTKTAVDPGYQRTRDRTYDHIPLGVVRIDTKRKVTYVNGAMTELWGQQSLIGTDFMVFITEPESQKVFRREMRRRFQKLEGSQYEIVFTRPGDGRQIPVAISAAPEFGDNGELLGSIAFIRDLSFEKANCAIHQAIESETTSGGILKICATVLQGLIPHDCFRITIVSQNRKHLRPACEEPALTICQNDFKWWPMPAFVLEFLSRKNVHDLDLDAWFDRPEARELARSDEATKRFLKLGFKHVLVRPVLSGGQIIAFVALDTRDKNGFSAAQIKLCEELPIADAVLKALQIERQRELEFSIRLIREMGKVADDLFEVGKVLVNELRSHYKWEHVSLLKVDEDACVFRLLVQAAAENMKLPDDFTQPLREGFLGRCFVSGAPVNEGNIHDAAVENVHRGDVVGSQSEMCIPVPGRKLRWILNVEASMQNAFADEEQAGVEFLLQETGFILERTALLELKSSILGSIKDAVLQTNSRGLISEANPAAEQLLGAEAAALLNRNLSDFIVGEEMATAVLTADAFPRAEVEMKGAGGASFPALLSGARLPYKGGKIFVASDRTFQKRVEQTELLKEVFLRVAMETRAPLALVSTWLHRAADLPANTAELVEKSMRQLKKMDVTLERVMRVASTVESSQTECAAIDIRALVDELVDQLPEADANIVERNYDKDLDQVSGDRRDLQFCINNVVGVLLRSRAQQDTVVVAARNEPSCVALELQVRSLGADATQCMPLTDEKRALPTEMAYGVDVLRATLEKMGGTLETDGTLQTAFAIRLPIAV
jgi:PAS domain S-box-containing protein